MTTWYDVSDLTTWTLPHLTGIQRTTVGILQGLVDRGLDLRLVEFDQDCGSFVPIEAAALPPAVQRHLPWPAESVSDSCQPMEAASPQPSIQRRKKRLISRDTIFGTSPAAAELRLAFREFKQASRQLRKRLRRWASVRFFVGRRPLPSLRPALRGGGHTRPVTTPVISAGGPIGPGDVLLSLGASWPIAGHAEAAAALRRQGVTVLRMIYDLIPVIKPQWVDEQTVKEVTTWARNVLTESTSVLTISEFSRREIERYCEESRFATPPVAVVRLGDTLPSGDEPTPPLPRFVPRRPFFVCVSTLDVRKNHRLLYDAWQVLAARDPESCPDLVCLGVPHVFVTDLLREIRHDRTVNGRIHLLHGVEDTELAWYYRHCAATIYPSRYEGWGLPVAESLGHGRLCLASEATSIPEISSDLPAFFDPFDVHGLVRLIDKTLAEPEWVRQREATIREQFQPTPWTHTADQVLAAITAAGHQLDGRSAA